MPNTITQERISEIREMLQRIKRVRENGNVKIIKK